MRSAIRWLRSRMELAGDGYPLLYPVVTVSGSFVIIVVAVIQRLPIAPPWWVLWGAAVALLSLLLDLKLQSKLPCTILASVSTGLMLMDPVPLDIAPLFLALTTAIAAAMESLRASLGVAALSICVIVVAAATDHLESPAAALLAVLCGWLVGYMMLYQKLLSQNEVRDQRVRADRAALDERRRIAREVHDVIAHSLSITMLNVTGARRALEDGDRGDALEALEDAERLGRQAMTEIRYIVKVLGTDDADAAPTPGVCDVEKLVEEYRRAGLIVTLDIIGDVAAVPAPVGTALYRIAQESLANVVKHAPNPEASVTLRAEDAVTLSVRNPYTPSVRLGTDGSGIEGMKQRARLLGGVVDATGNSDSWVVRASFPPDPRHAEAAV
ncbi:histidine kinase [Gordonia sp. PKS22-38]|uniref:histidine kinase n=1 Tax=Gordonia prachuapensis TaxID=3115651 RepID=A0ABU7MYE3_9ACTN|nr:histidine kinase [Gordonia sp. PKS22-38]